MTPSILAGRPNLGFKTMILKFFYGLLNHQTLIPLKTFGNLWSYLKRKPAEYARPPYGILELWERVQTEWDKIDSKVCQDLIESMPRRVAAVIKAKGGYTKC